MHSKRLFQKLNKRLFAVVCAVVIIAAAAVTLCVNLAKDMDYVVYVDGKAVCSVKDEAVLEQALELLNLKHEQLGVT